MKEDSVAVQGWVSGVVQGVGFRYFVATKARAEALVGYARNLQDGRVEVWLQGEAEGVLAVRGWVERGSVSSIVKNVQWKEVDVADMPAFTTA